MFHGRLEIFFSHLIFMKHTCNGWNVRRNGTTSVPMSVLRYVVDKVKLFVPIPGTVLQCQYAMLSQHIKSNLSKKLLS